MAWHVKARGGYTISSTEAQENAQEIYAILYGLGWTVNAISGLLGNMEVESGYNHWRWHRDRRPSVTKSPWTTRR